MAKSKPGFSLNELRKSVDHDGGLDLSLKELTEKDIPVKEMGEILSLRQLDLSVNHLESLPDNFCSSLTRLTKLDLSKNRLTRLPSNIGRLTNLEHLDLYTNNLRRLPTTFASLKKLKWLDLKNNAFEDPRLAKLAALCITPEGCGACARQTVALMGEIQREEDRARSEKHRIQKELEESKKKAEEAEAERQRQERKQAKEKRKADAMMAKKAAAEVSKASREKEHFANGSPKKTDARNGSAKEALKKGGGFQTSRASSLAGLLLRTTFFVAMLIGVAFITLTFLHANGNYSAENLAKSWSMVTSDALKLYDSGRSSVVRSAAEIRETLLKNDSVKKFASMTASYLEELTNAVVRAGGAVSEWVGSFDWSGVKDRMASTLSYVGDVIQTYGPAVHKSVRDAYASFVKTIYQGGLIAYERVHELLKPFL